MPRLTSPSRRRAFTLIELLVVITIIGIAVGVSFPILNVLRTSGRVSAATNTVSVAVDAARLVAVTSDNFTVTGLPGGQRATYDGTAIIFTPSGECRLVVNDQSAQEPGGAYFELSDLAPSHPAYPNRVNAYHDVAGRDYIALPPGTGVAGMRRDASGITFLPPPFAIAFDEDGRLVSLDPSVLNGAIFYDRDNDGNYERTGSNRPAGYNPDTWDGRVNAVNQVGTGTSSDIDRKRYELPFDAIETVQAVAVYNREAFDNAGLTWAGSSPAQIEAFMTTPPNPDDARVLFFSRATGVVIRN